MTVTDATVATALDIETFHYLRTTVEQGREARWRTNDELTVGDAARWLHLPPPTTGAGAGGSAWRRSYRFGLLYLRWGPGFCRIRERRPGHEAAIYSVDDDELVGCLRRLVAITDHACEVCQELDEYGLVFNQGARRTLAPVRLRRPPIPFSGI